MVSESFKDALVMLLSRLVVEPEQVLIRVDNITSSSSSLSASAAAQTAVTLCWLASRVGDFAKYELNIASDASSDVEQIWIDAANMEQGDDALTGRRRRCHRLNPANLPAGQLHYILLRPWTVKRRPGLSVVALFSLSGS